MYIKHKQKLCSQEENFSLSIVDGGNAFCDTHWCATEIAPPYTRLYYIVDGEAEIKTDQGALRLTAGKLYMLPMGYSFSHRCDGNMHQLYFHLNLTNTYGIDIFQKINQVFSKKVSESHIQTLLSLFEQETIASRGYLKAILQADIFSLLAENQIDIKNNRHSDLIRKVLIFIEKNLSTSLTIKEISDNLCVSASTLSHSFKSEMGVSLGKYIDGMVMFKVEQLLLTTELPLSWISNKLGFCDQFYLSRRFKEKHSVSPLKYRKMHQSNS